jgi:hypothetical protein
MPYSAQAAKAPKARALPGYATPRAPHRTASDRGVTCPVGRNIHRPISTDQVGLLWTEALDIDLQGHIVHEVSEQRAGRG